MPTKVDIPEPFRKELKRLARKFPKVIDSVESLIENLEDDQRPGDKIPEVGFEVYKVRLSNPSAGRGKSGGFRIIYYVQLADSVVLITIYSKTEQANITPEKIRQILKDLLSDSEE